MQTNVLFIRIDRDPEIYKELNIIKAQLGVRSYAELLRIFIDAFKDNPDYFMRYKEGRFKFIGIK